MKEQREAPSLEGVWESRETLSEMTLGGRPIEVPSKNILKIGPLLEGTVQGTLTVYIMLSKAEGLPPGVSDTSQAFDIRGTYEDPHVLLTTYNDDGTVNAEHRGPLLEDGHTLRLTSTVGENVFVYIRQIDKEGRTDDDS